jgi:plastocyanin
VSNIRNPTNNSQVTVGGPGGLIYSPESISAAVGDMVVFTFLSNNHTATQSAFDTPCKKLADGVDSGFMANVNNTIVPAPQMAMQVTVATPICMPLVELNRRGLC